MKQIFYYNLITQDCSAHLQHLFFCKSLHVEPNFSKIRSSRAQRAWSSTVHVNFSTQKDGRWAPVSGTPSSCISDWNYCIHLGAGLPNFSLFAGAVSQYCISQHQWPWPAAQSTGIYITTVSGFRLWLLHICEISCLHCWGKNSSYKLSLDFCPGTSSDAAPQPKCSSGTISLDTLSLVGSSPNRRDSALTNGMSGCHESTSLHCVALAYSLQNILMAHWAGSTCGTEMLFHHQKISTQQMNYWVKFYGQAK